MEFLALVRVYIFLESVPVKAVFTSSHFSTRCEKLVHKHSWHAQIKVFNPHARDLPLNKLRVSRYKYVMRSNLLIERDVFSTDLQA